MKIIHLPPGQADSFEDRFANYKKEQEPETEGYTVISPLGKRAGLGTFETFWDSEKYPDVETAIKANNCCIVDFVEKEGTVYFQFHNIAHPDHKEYYRLNQQHFPFGIDVLDDNMACGIMERFI